MNVLRPGRARERQMQVMTRLAAILTLAIGLGPTVAMFTIVHGALIRPLPYPEPERVVTPLVVIHKTGAMMPPPVGQAADSLAAMESIDLAARVSVGGGLLLGGSDPVNTFGSGVETPFFRIFGMPIALGRLPARAGEGAISSRLWEQRFGRRDDVIGKVVRYRDETITIVGVAAASYDFPYRNDIWYVMADQPGAADQYVDMALRLAPGVTIERARSELALIQAALERDSPNSLAGGRLELQSFQEAETGYLRRPLLTLFAAAALVVLVACANVANLLLAAGEGRRHEMAVRRALGASRRRLVSGLLRESAWLAAAGVGAGIVLATWTVPLILATAPDIITRRTDFSLSWPVLAFASALAALVTLAFGMAPALRLSRVPEMTAIRAASPAVSGGGSWLMTMSLGVQAAVGVVLVVGTALLLVSFSRLTGGIAAVPADQLSVVRLDVGQTPALARAIADEVAAGLVAPSDGRIAAASGLPLHPVLPVRVTLPGQTEPVRVPVRSISPGYFALVRQRLVLGRDFDAGDRVAGVDVAIVSETLARQVAESTGATPPRTFRAAGTPGRDAIGSSLMIDLPGGSQGRARAFQVVGIAGDVRASVSSRPGPEVYVAFSQVAYASRGSWLYVIGPAAQSAFLASEVKRIVRGISAETPIGDVARLDALFGDRLTLPRFHSTLVSSFGIIALALATAGVFAVVGYGVARRTRELAVRVALGATRRDVTRVIVPGVAVPVIAGLVAGLAIATRLAPSIRSMIFYEVSPTQPSVYAAATVAFLTAAAIATWLPLRRAWRLNPAETLRRE